MKILTVVGARPQFIKASVLSSEYATRNWHECLVHTGQHYDYEMSEIFFDQLQIRRPDYNLGVGSASHAVQTAEMMKGLEPILESIQPDWVIVIGDTNTTLAAALTAAKMGLPVAHVEAGLRSHTKDMPEEINRIVVDHISTLLFTPTMTATKNIEREGIDRGVYEVGDVLVEIVRRIAAESGNSSAILNRFDVEPGAFALMTLHRASNTLNLMSFQAVIESLKRLPYPVIFPLHPRTAPLVPTRKAQNVKFCEPLSYSETVVLEKNARVIITDSGGIQREAYILGTPCVTVRDETEWIETLAGAWNVLVGNSPDRLIAAALRERPRGRPEPLFGSGSSAQGIAAVLQAQMHSQGLPRDGWPVDEKTLSVIGNRNGSSATE